MSSTQLICENCHTPNPVQAVHCQNCGNNLRDMLKADEMTAYVGEPSDLTQTLHNRKAFFGRDAHMKLYIVKADQVVLCDLSQNMFTLGRNVETPIPHLDLSPYNAADLGVSRLHARITRMHAVLVLEDLGALNGTFVNRERISPVNPCVLCHDDEIHLGNFPMKVIFEN